MWFGATIAGLRTSPKRHSSVTPVIISAVLPAPTSWASSTAGSWMIRATAATWRGRGRNVSARPGSNRLASS